MAPRALFPPKTSAPVSIEIANGDGYTRPPLHDFFMTRYTEAYANEIASFISAIEKAPRSPRRVPTAWQPWRWPTPP